MFYGLLVALFTLACMIIIFLILLQKGKGSSGLGALGGGQQMIFGGGGGQDLFQKVTWALGFVLIFGTLLLALMKTNKFTRFNISKGNNPVQTQIPKEEKVKKL